MMNMQLHKQNQGASAAATGAQQMSAASHAHILSQLHQHQQNRMPSPQSQPWSNNYNLNHKNTAAAAAAPYQDQEVNNAGDNLTHFQQPPKKAKHPQYPSADGIQHQAHEGSAGMSIKMTSTMGNANESFEEVSAISAFQVAQMNVIGGGGSGEELMALPYDMLKKGKISKGKGGSIIVMNQNDQLVSQPLNIKTVKKTTASQNKFDIKQIVASAQDGAPSRKTQSHDRSHPSNNSAAPILGNAAAAAIGNHQPALHHPLIQPQSQSNERKPNKTAGPQYTQQLQQQPVQIIQQNAQGNNTLFASFFSQPKEHYEFLTKTLGCTPNDTASSHQPQLLKQAPQSTHKPKKSAQDTISIIKKDSIINLKHNVDSSQQAVQKQLSNSKFNNQPKKQQTPIIYKSFQHPVAAAPGSSSHKPLVNPKFMMLTTNGGGGGQSQADSSMQYMNNTLQAFTQNYYGAQLKKKQTLQKKVTQVSGNQQHYQHRREHSENNQTMKNSTTQLVVQKTANAAAEGGNGSSRQLRLGQIMEELEKFSISNQPVSGEIVMNNLIADESWAVESQGGTTTVHQSSVCESDLEYTQLGNIRASTYKRTVENQEARKRLKKYKSEERKHEPSFFTKEYMDNRYVNDRVEMELKDFKAEIEKKYEGSKLRDFKYPRIVIKAASSTSRPNRQIKALAPNQQHPYLYQNQQSRGHSLEDGEPSSSQNPRITLGGKNVILKSSTTQQQQGKPSNSQVKHKNISILDELPVEIIKTQDMRQQMPGFAKQNGGEMLSFNESMNDINQHQQQQQLTQDSIHFIENKKHNHHQHSNSHGPQKQPASVLLQNFFAKQSFDNRTSSKPSQQQQPPLTANMTQSTTKKSSKLVNNSQDSIGQHHFNTFDAHEQSRTKGNQTVLLNKLNNEKQQQQQQLDQQAASQKATLQAQKQTPKNYSLQLNQVVKKILNDSSSDNNNHNTMASVPAQQPKNNNAGLNSTSFDNNMLYEPSFYTTESYKQKKQMASSNDRQQHVIIVGGQDNEMDPVMMQTYMTNNNHHTGDQVKRSSGKNPAAVGVGASTAKKQLKVKQRSDSNGSSGQQKNTLLNKIYRSSKAIKSPQSRQSNMNLNNQNAINPALQCGRAGEILRIAKPSHTVNQTNVNSTLSSVRQLQILSKQAPISHSRQGSSGMRQQPHQQAKSTGKTSTSGGAITTNTRLPSSSTSKKHHQHNLSHVPSQQQQQLIGNSVMFQTDTGASFHNYPNQNSNRNNSKDKKQQILIKNNQIKRSSGERSNRDAKDSKSIGQTKLLLDPAHQQQFALMQRSFHNQPGSSQQALNSNQIQNLIISKQNNMVVQTSSTGMKGSVASSPTQKLQHKKNQSLTSKNTQRSVMQSQGKLVNLGILGQISNPQTNGKGGKITYRNNYPRINTNTNSNSLLVAGDLNNRLIPQVSTGMPNAALLMVGGTTLSSNNYLSAQGIYHKNNNSAYYHPERLPSQGDVSAFEGNAAAYHSIDYHNQQQQLYSQVKKGSSGAGITHTTSGSVDTNKLKKGASSNYQPI